MDIKDIKVPSITVDLLVRGPLPEPEVCGLPVRAGEEPDDPHTSTNEEEEEDDRFFGFDEDDLQNAVDLMETSMMTLGNIIDDPFVIMPVDLKKQLRNHRLDLYAFLREWTDIDKRLDAQEEKRRDKQRLKEELSILLSGIEPDIIEGTRGES